MIDAQTILESIHEPIVVSDARHAIVFANRSAEHLLGYSPGALRDQPLECLFATHQAPSGDSNGAVPWRLHVWLVAHGGREIAADLELDHIDDGQGGLDVWLVHLDGAPSGPHIEVLAEAVQHRAEEFETMASSLPEGIVITHGDVISFSNRAASRLLGISASAPFTPSPQRSERSDGLEDVGESRPAVLHQILEDVLAGRVVTGREAHFENTNGHGTWVQLSGAPAKDAAGGVSGAIVVATEITRLKELEHTKDEWLAIAAHELRTPLTPIMVHLQMAQRRLAMGRQIGPEVFDKALEQVKRLSRLVNGLLDVTRLQTGQLDLTLETLDLREIAERVVDRVRQSTTRHTLVVDVSSTPVRVRGDPARLDEVVAALVDNAIKYSPDGGEIWVSVHRRGPGATLAVRDPGIGIAPEERAQIFERYFRAGNVPQMQYGGLGLGLWISGKVVQRLGGHIELESVVGRGSTFTVVLPFAEPRAAAADTTAEPTRARVLVVDDDFSVLEAVEALLDDEGYEVRVATSGADAIQEARSWMPDVMLLDLRMPGMDGWEVRRRFEADPTLMQIPVVLVSADRDARARAGRMNAQAFIAKPFDLGELESVLNSILKRPVGLSTKDTGRVEA